LPTSRRTSRRSEARSVFLFGRDLRLEDHAGLAEASRFGVVVPVLVVDPPTVTALARNHRRAAYYSDAVAHLAESLAARGTRLVVRRGPVARTARTLARELDAQTIVWSASYDARAVARERDLQSSLEEAGLRARAVHDAPSVAPDEIAAARAQDDGRGYRSFGPFLAAWSELARTPFADRTVFVPANELASEPLPGRAEFGARDEAATGGRDASASLDAYLSGPALEYPAARNVPAGAPTARLSAALSFGTISARTVLARIDARMRDPFLLVEERASVRALATALARRDFFLQLAWFFEDQPDEALQPRMRGFPVARDHPALAAWRGGRTGFPLVDAGMRQLTATGWMHPRVRAIVASFLCFDLGVDWRVGRDAWDAYLEEDDPALASGNWQWIAGVGADLAQVPRIYNPAKQLRRFDPAGRYVRRYVGELSNMPDADLFGTAASPDGQMRLPLFGAGAYPRPVVVHEEAASAFLRRYAAFTRNA